MLPVIITIFFSSFLIALSGALMPGPLLTVTLSESSRRGASAGPLMIVGHGILELAMVALLLSGLAPVLMRDDVFVGVSIAGGCILMWMGISMMRELPNMKLEIENHGERKRNLVTTGIVLSLANPYWVIWWASIGLGYIVYSAKFGAAGIISFFLGHIAADLLWYSCVSYGVVRGRHFLTDTGYRRLIGGCALFLVAFAAYFFYSGLDRLV